MTPPFDPKREMRKAYNSYAVETLVCIEEMRTEARAAALLGRGHSADRLEVMANRLEARYQAYEKASSHWSITA